MGHAAPKITPSLAASSEPDDPAAAAEYIAALVADLAGIARRSGLDTLGYVLDMARVEAENASRPTRSSR
jgi:hypothetical protein